MGKENNNGNQAEIEAANQAAFEKRMEADTYFRNGFSSGFAGREFPLREFLNISRLQITPIQAEQFHDGFVAGISKKLEGLKIEPASIGVTESLDHVLREDIAISGLNAGLQRRPPVLLNEKPRSEQNTSKAHYVEGYRIGWVIAVAKKYRAIPSVEAIPTDPLLYKLHMKAEKGNFADIEYKEQYEDSNTRVAKKMARGQPLSKEPQEKITYAVLAFATDRWLASKGIRNVKADVVLYLRPQVRRGFAAVINREPNGKKNRQDNDFKQGADFARRILRIKRLTEGARDL